jgi:hypothetical protein
LFSRTLSLGFLSLGQQALTGGLDYLCRDETKRLSEKENKRIDEI